MHDSGLVKLKSAFPSLLFLVAFVGIFDSEHFVEAVPCLALLVWHCSFAHLHVRHRHSQAVCGRGFEPDRGPATRYSNTVLVSVLHLRSVSDWVPAGADDPEM